MGGITIHTEEAVAKQPTDVSARKCDGGSAVAIAARRRPGYLRGVHQRRSASWTKVDGTRGGPWRPAPDPLVGQTIDGRFEVRARIAADGSSEVYRVCDRRDGSEGVLKLLSAASASVPALRARFAREVERSLRFGGRVVPAVRASGLLDGLPYLLCDGAGPTLRERPRGPMPAGEAVALARAVLERLAVLHEAGLVHRDLKPAHVARRGAWLLDLGSAAVAGRPDPDAHGPCFAPGTPAYAAPEQWNESAPVDARSDLYAVGVLLYELLCGQRPFSGDPLALIEAHARLAPPSPRALQPALSPQLESAVLAALEKDPDRRPADTASLRAWLADTPEAARCPDLVP